MSETKFTPEIVKREMKKILEAQPPAKVYWFLSEGVLGRCEVHDFMKPLPMLPKKT
jgi:hypothetical protein